MGFWAFAVKGVLDDSIPMVKMAFLVFANKTGQFDMFIRDCPFSDWYSSKTQTEWRIRNWSIRYGIEDFRSG